MAVKTVLKRAKTILMPRVISPILVVARAVWAIPFGLSAVFSRG